MRWFNNWGEHLKGISIKTDYLENKSRQNNISIHKVKEGAEKNDTGKFVEVSG
jgi:hypothetical protein